MRWFVFILLVFPNFVMADKATRDKAVQLHQYLAPCKAVFDLYFQDNFKRTQLYLQYEIDEKKYTPAKMDFSAHLFKIVYEKNITKIKQNSALTASELEYIHFKTEGIYAISAKLAETFMQNPTQLASEWSSCVNKFNLHK